MARIPEEMPQCPEHFNFAVDVVDKWAAETPSPQALLWVDQNGRNPLSLDYAYFSKRSHRAAGLLARLGVKKGDRVIIILPRVPAWWEVATAVIRLGGVVCPCTTLAVAHDIEYRAQASGATVFVGDSVSLEKFNSVRKNCPNVRLALQAAGAPLKDTLHISDDNPEIYRAMPQTKWSDPSMILFYSGTTGNAKDGASQPSLISFSPCVDRTSMAGFGAREALLEFVRAGIALHAGWAKAAWAWFGAWNCGAALFVQETVGPFSAEQTLDNLHNYPITTLCAPPTAYRQFVLPSRQEYFRRNPPMRLEHCVGAGEPLNDQVIRTWKEMCGLEIRDGYGQTETTLVCGNIKGNKVKFGSMGKPLPGVPLTVITPEGEESPAEEEGEIAIATTTPEGFQTLNIFSGYLKPDGTVLRPTRQGKGRSWYLTGDRAYRDDEGYLWFVGRSDDVINSSGYRIGPFEVESVLKKHPAVVESAVVASPDAARVEVVKAFIVLQDEYKSRDSAALIAELQDFCKAETAPYKYPRRIQFVEPGFLPKTISGKIKRAELRALEKKIVERAQGAKI
ncbi:acetyl-coenzyme A synthetase [Coccidioides immitis RMSCC 3703]|uniref:medium-chain acyl-CoA ligase n=1 Tax=Coccidioides immitis RMSCC 3703 TaxID=454286 RepID=A0A0J8QU01_COCIT|nr:acetyl-coenzyme A synthetase [Coccidioides immitis RMSCC 3703]